MNYEKLNVERFIANAKEGKYKGLTGARRAIGKTAWSEEDKDKAQKFAAKFFGGSDAVVASAKAKAPSAKKTAKKTTSVPPKAASGSSPPKALKTPKAPKVAKKPGRKASASTQEHASSPAGIPILTFVGDGTTARNFAAATMAATLRNNGPLTQAEEQALAGAIEEYNSTLLHPAKMAPASAAHTETSYPRIAIPTGIDESRLSVEEREQHERLKRAAEASRYINGGS